MTTPDFSSVSEILRDRAWEAFEESDAAAIMGLVGNQKRGTLLLDNVCAFLEKGIYEEALLECYIHGPHYCSKYWRLLFSHADRARLLALGDAIPTEPIIVYRGIRHCKHRRWLRGMSWTTNPKTAAWFASRCPSPDRIPAVYALTVNPEDILLMTNERSEEEVIVAIWQCEPLKRLLPILLGMKPAGLSIFWRDTGSGAQVSAIRGVPD